MSETVNQENATKKQTVEQPQPEAQNEKLFTQDEVNGFFKKRYSDLMSQLESYKEKAAKYDELEEANKSELQKATERAEKLQAELNGMKKASEVRELREKVAKEAGIPAASMSLLTGETEEVLKEQAKTILSFAVPGTYPQIPDGGEVRNLNKATAKDQFKNWASQVF